MLNFLRNSIINFRGARIGRKIVVIESDDWGSVRMSSKKALNDMDSLGHQLSSSAYNRYDALESEEDLTFLFDLLSKFSDKHGNCPVITANTVVANPDFEKIRDARFQQYFFEPFTETFKRYGNCERSFDLWKQAINLRLFKPQFHCREHLNKQLWLDKLLQGDKVLLDGFQNQIWCVGLKYFESNRVNIYASYDAGTIEELSEHKKSIIEGVSLFEKIFGFSSKTFIANNYIWSSDLNETLRFCGIDAFQGMKFQLLPIINCEKRRKVRRYFGEVNELGQSYFIRNCVFEPSLSNARVDSVDSCLRQISNAFLFNKPAIISMHRLNFIGSIDKKNRDQNLLLFDSLLKQITTKWPDVEFCSSDELLTVLTM